jgi:DNA-binding transcriptional LysR family regulator
MELRQLKSFCTAARLRSISKAAEQLGIGQPTVTTHIQQLETELGTQLFDRVRRPIQLTAAGGRLFELAAPLVGGVDGLVEAVADSEAAGPVRIGSTYDMVPHTLLNVVKAFVVSHPHVHLRIRSGSAREVVHMVDEGEVDLGIVPGPEEHPMLEFVGLFAYERVLITPLGHPLTRQAINSLDQIARFPLILRRQGTSTRTLLEREFQRHGLSYEIVVELDSMDIIKRYVALGLGISVGPKLAIDPHDYEELSIASLSTLLPVEWAGVVTLRGKTLSKPVRDFIGVMKEILGPRGEERQRQAQHSQSVPQVRLFQHPEAKSQKGWVHSP